MNVGIAAGRVLDYQGRGVRANISLVKVTGDLGKIPISDMDNHYGQIHSRSDASGRFLIKYQWSGTEIGEVITPPLVFMVAWTENGSGVMGLRGAAQTLGHLVKDIKRLKDSAVGVFDNRDSIKEFAESLAKLQIALATSESWILASGLLVYIK